MAPKKVKSCKTGRMVTIGGAAHKAHLEWKKAEKKYKGSKSKSTPKPKSRDGQPRKGYKKNPNTGRMIKIGGPTDLALKRGNKGKHKTKTKTKTKTKMSLAEAETKARKYLHDKNPNAGYMTISAQHTTLPDYDLPGNQCSAAVMKRQAPLIKQNTLAWNKQAIFENQ